MWPFVTAFFPLEKYFQSSSMLYHLSVFHFLFIAKHKSMAWCTAFYWSVHHFDGYSGCFYFLLLWLVLLWTFEWMFMCGPIFSLFTSEYLGVEFLDLMVVLSLTFWETAKLFSLVSLPFYIPTTSVWGFQFLHVFANTCYFQFVCLSYSHSKECAVVSHFGFDVHFLNDEWHWAVFPVLIGHLYILFWETSIQIICPFKNCVACLFTIVL